MGGGGGGQPTQTTAYNTNIPEYAKPYVMNMLGAGQNQLFTTTPGQNGEPGEITGFRPYQAYSSNPADYFAGPSSLQTSAYNAAGQLQSPSQYQVGTSLAGAAGLGQLGTAQQAGAYGAQGVGLGQQGVGLGQMGALAAMPAFGAGQNYARMVTDPNAVGQYMSPYQQQVTDVAKAAAVREAQIANTAGNLASARSGTYGGARQALAQAERERGLLANLSNIQATGNQNAYNQAIQNMQYGQNLGLQGIQTGLQGIAAGQQGISQGMQGIGQGLQGVGAQQAGYAGAGQAASTLGQLGTAQNQTDVANIGLQNQLGQQQQQYQQGIINQAVQDYATAQQYPYMQLSMMSNLLRGLPMQAMSTQQYQAQAPIGQQAAGLLGAYGAYKGAFKEGGAVVPGYNVGGLPDADESLKAKMEKMAKANPQGLAKLVESSTSKEVKDMGKEVLSGIARANTGGLMTNMAGGGIVAFSGEDNSYVDPAGNYAYSDSNYGLGDMFHSIGTFGRSLIGLPEYVSFEDQERERKRKELAAKGEKPDEKKDDKGPAVPPAAPSAAPGANPPSSSLTGLAGLNAQKFMADRDAMYRARGIEPGMGERGKKLLEYYDKSLGGLGAQTAEAQRFNKAIAAIEAGQDPRGLASGLSTGAKSFLKGEAEIQRQQRAREQALMEAGEKVESGHRKEAKGDIDGAMKDFADARRDLTSIRTAEIAASAHGIAGKQKEDQIKQIQADHKARTGKDMSYSDALAEHTRLTHTAEGTAEARAKIAANTAYEKWEAALFMNHPDLLDKARKGDKKAIAELNKLKEDKYQELLKRNMPDKQAADNTKSGAVDTKNPLLGGKG